MNRFLLLIIFSVALFACSDDTNGPVQIRIENISQLDFQSVLVNTGGGEQQYGRVNSGMRSPYKGFESAYRYAYVEIQIKGEEYRIQPIDYVGETLLEPGKYTYEIDAVEENGEIYLSIALAE